MGFVAHTDKNFMNRPHLNQVDGLDIKAKEGQWFGVELCPSSFVVMAGDAIMVCHYYLCVKLWTSGITYMSIAKESNIWKLNISTIFQY